MSGFPAYLRALIAAAGPQPVERVMAEALGHPVHGYYMGRDPFGAAGDFVTAPEISQMFGELIGVWAAQVWADQGRRPFVLAELGPGSHRSGDIAETLGVESAESRDPLNFSAEARSVHNSCCARLPPTCAERRAPAGQ